MITIKLDRTSMESSGYAGNVFVDGVAVSPTWPLLGGITRHKGERFSVAEARALARLLAGEAHPADYTPGLWEALREYWRQHNPALLAQQTAALTSFCERAGLAL